MPTYDAFVDLVQNWANKDSSVLSDSITQDCMRYAADTSYRTLRVSALEQTVEYTKTQLDAATTSANNRAASKTELTIPADLLEFIQLREVDDDGRTCRVFNEKTDLRTFNDIYAEKTQSAYWSRVGNVLVYSPGFGTGFTSFIPTKAELHYYKRLPALNATYDVTPTNYAGGFLTQSNSGTTRLYFVDGNTQTAYATQALAEAAITSTGADKVTAKLVSVGTGGVANAIAVDTRVGTIASNMALSGNGVDLNSGAQPTVSSITAQAGTTATVVMSNAQTIAVGTDLVFSKTNSAKYVGNEVAHWLRDENEKVLLYGSLAEVFYYLQDEDQAKKYKQLFTEEIALLNNEDNKRGASGGNVQVNYNGRRLI